MTARHAGYYVVLEKDIREDDAQPILNAIKQIKGVLNVTPIVSTPDLWMAQERAKNELINKIYKVVEDGK